MERAKINLHLGDSLEAMQKMPDNAYELAIVDPPYGINVNPNLGLKKGLKKRHEKIDWDNEIPSKKYFYELFKKSRNQIIWGGELLSVYLEKWVFTFYFLG